MQISVKQLYRHATGTQTTILACYWHLNNYIGGAYNYNSIAYTYIGIKLVQNWHSGPDKTIIVDHMAN